MENNIVQKQDKEQVNLIKQRKEKKFLPIVVTSRIARNRLDMMNKEIDNVKLLNQQKFYG